MSKTDLKKYFMLFVAVIVSIGVANTLQRRVPVAGGIIGKVMDGI